MAEAVVEVRRYYCHRCNHEFLNSSSNIICPRCSEGFVEELQDNDDSTLRSSMDISTTSDEDDLETLADLMFGRNSDSSIRRSENGATSETRTGPQGSGGGGPSTNSRYMIPLENLFQDFIINLGGGINWAGPGNVQLFLGNPGDYAWGQEGLDAIVTQLLNQMDSAGPPPVSKAVIDGLQMVEVTPEQVALNLQCSVCWDNFQLKEQVKQLPCQHIYHEKCIRPWLELHGTCPICRKNLEGERSSENASGTETDNNRSPVPNFESALRSLFASTSSTSTGSSSGSNNQNGSNNWNRNNDSM